MELCVVLVLHEGAINVSARIKYKKKYSKYTTLTLTVGRKKTDSGESDDVWSSSDMVRIIKSRRMRWVGRATRVGEAKIHAKLRLVSKT